MVSGFTCSIFIQNKTLFALKYHSKFTEPFLKNNALGFDKSSQMKIQLQKWSNYSLPINSVFNAKLCNSKHIFESV